MFLSQATYAGDVGSVTGADEICGALAASAGLLGEFVALLGDAARSPIDRLAGSRGWVDLNDQPIVDTPADWLTARHRRPLLITNTGQQAPFGYRTWHSDGLRNCAGWTSNAAGDDGLSSARASALLGTGQPACSTANGLVCAEIGHRAALPPEAEPGRTTFISTQRWAPDPLLGIAGADAVCTTEAAGAGLTGSYLALLATSEGNGFHRFDLGGPVWRRVDGVPITATAAAFAEPSGWLSAYANLTAAGAPVPGYAYTWSGGPGLTCADWTNQDAGLGRGGDAHLGDLTYFRASSDFWPCSTELFLVCLEE